jgi:hypothetical protein
MSQRLVLIALLLAGLLTTETVAKAQPTELYTCTSLSTPTCYEVWGPGILGDCFRLFDVFIGQVAYYPLRCIGPITIAIENLSIPSVQFPLYLEVVPLGESPAPCANDPGYLVHIVRGVEGGCGGWETSPQIDITEFVPIGTLYALRLRYLYNRYGYSPATDCVRVTAVATTSAVEHFNWGTVKTLYK